MYNDTKCKPWTSSHWVPPAYQNGDNKDGDSPKRETLTQDGLQNGITQSEKIWYMGTIFCDAAEVARKREFLARNQY